MEFDFSKLLGRIVEKFGTRSAFATAIGMTDPSLSNRLNNKISFDMEEIYQACEALDIQPEEIGAYFFTPKVR